MTFGKEMNLKKHKPVNTRFAMQAIKHAQK
jgi:hypothetical protein